MSQAGSIVFSKPRQTPPQPDQALDFYEIREDGTVLTPIVLNRIFGSDGQLTATLSFRVYSEEFDSQKSAGDLDFDSTSFTVVFEEGETSKTISIPIFQDQLVEGDEYLIIEVAGGEPVFSITILDPTSAIVKISDDDPSSQASLNVDFNNDQKGDLFWVNSSGALEIWTFNGFQYTRTPLDKDDSGWFTQAIADFNNDGNSDLLRFNVNTNEIEINLMNGSVISESIKLSIDDSTLFLSGIGDFGGDGKADLLWRDGATGNVRIREINGTESPSYAADFTWEIQALGDFNGDRKADILWRDRTTGEVGVWQMNGTERDQTSILLTLTDANWNVQGLGDFNADGKADILWYNANTTEVGVWQMNGTAFEKTNIVMATRDRDWQIKQIADFNGDGADDILWMNSRSQEVAIWQMNGTRAETTKIVSQVGEPGWEIQTVSDFNGDGIADILWKKGTEIGLWQMKPDLTIDKAEVIGTVSDRGTWEVLTGSTFRSPVIPLSIDPKFATPLTITTSNPLPIV